VQLQHDLNQLVSAELVYSEGAPPNATYQFKHALIVDAAYHSLLRSSRRRIHGAVARVVLQQFPERAANEPEWVAYHYAQAGQPKEAAEYWLHAAGGAVERCSYREADEQLIRVLGMIEDLPSADDRIDYELRAQMLCGAVHSNLDGQGSDARLNSYLRARALCVVQQDQRQLLFILLPLQRGYAVRGQLDEARRTR
jgi:predicted ATPase